MVARSSLRSLRVCEDERRVGLVVRVSTDHQVRNPEGSLTTQLQRLRQHLEYKRSSSGADWSEAGLYELRGISGKDSMRSAEFEQLFADIRSGRVNTVMFASLSRLCRSVRDFLHFVEFLDEHGANFISLKEDYDTTSAHGRLIITVMMALNEFEREQTAERTRDAFQARAERGLWNGGRLLGYDLDPEHKGYLIPNEAESALVNYCVDAYLECGSIAETVSALNRRGFRTKAYRSRREVEHPGRAFVFTSVQHLLKNPAYIGKKLVTTDGREQLVEAVWPGIVDEEKFERVQQLLALNARSHHSGAKTIRHAHILGRGLLRCGRCQSKMQGRSGTGHGGAVYFYYACANKDCGLRVNAPELEGAVIDRIGMLASDPTIIDSLVSAAGARLRRKLPAMEKQLRVQRAALAQVADDASTLLMRTSDAAFESGKALIADQLRDLTLRRAELDEAVRATEMQVEGLRGAEVDTATVRSGLAHFDRVYAHLKPFEQQELIRLVVQGIEVGDRSITLDLYKKACAAFAQASKSVSRFEPPIWLPDEDSNLEHRG